MLPIPGAGNVGGIVETGAELLQGHYGAAALAAGGALLGLVGAGALAKVPKAVRAIRAGKAAKTLKAAEESEELVTVFRGVKSSHARFQEALKGVAKPRSPILGHTDPVRHNLGDTRSKFVSLTTKPEVAKRFARGDGVILKSRVQKSKLVPSPDVFDEGEVLLRGEIKDAQVIRPWDF